jgi:hypothetical protein
MSHHQLLAGYAGEVLETVRWALVTEASIAFEFISRGTSMKPEYGSHGEPTNLAVYRQHEEIAHMQHAEI